MRTLIKRGATVPQYQTPGSAAVDLHASKAATIPPGHRMMIHTGLYIALPAGYCADIKPRSGLALKHGITVVNTPGLIDEDYRNEICVVLINHGDSYFGIQVGDRIAQMELRKVERFEFVEVDELPPTSRTGGFGSTGA
jgi:dUTP pyrophosphatase